jgi:hypothetical protein
MNARPRKPLPRDPVIEAFKKDVDRTLLRENLRRTPEERVLVLMRLLEAAERSSAERAGSCEPARSHDRFPGPPEVAP